MAITASNGALQTDKGVIGSRSEIGLAYQEICRPDAFRSYCASGAPWCGRTDPPTARQEQAPGFYAAAAPALRRAVVRCGPNNIFKRSADALLIDIGINDVGFASWAAGIVLQDPALRCRRRRHDALLRWDRALRADAEPLRQARQPVRASADRSGPVHAAGFRHRPVACDRRRLSARTGKRGRGVFCPQGNSGLTIATFPPPPCRFRSQTPAAARALRRGGGRARGISRERPGRKGCRAGAGETERSVSPHSPCGPRRRLRPRQRLYVRLRQARRLRDDRRGKAARRPARRVSRRWIFSTCAARPKPTRRIHARAANGAALERLSRRSRGVPAVSTGAF